MSERFGSFRGRCPRHLRWRGTAKAQSTRHRQTSEREREVRIMYRGRRPSERCEPCIEGGARGTCGGKGLPKLNQPAIRRPASVSERFEPCIEGGGRGTCGAKALPNLNQPAIRRRPAFSESVS